MTETFNESFLSVSTINRIIVDRPLFDQEQLNSEFKYFKPVQNIRSFIQSKCGECSAKKFFYGLFPILSWLPSYNIKSDLIKDISAGFTVALIHISFGMGYAQVANLPPICGFYTAFFPVLMYVIFGTSKHISIGTTVVISVMVGKMVRESADPRYFDSVTDTEQDATEPMGYSPLQVVSASSLMIGLVQLVLFLLRLGIKSTLLSDTMIIGFTLGGAIHVLISQIKELLGITILEAPYYFENILVIMEMFQKIAMANYITVLMAIGTIIVLILYNVFMKPWVVKKMNIPFPLEILILICGTIISYYANLNGIHDVKIIGYSPIGILPLQSITADLLGSVAFKSLMIVTVGITLTMTSARVLDEKVKSPLNFNQEILAVSSGNILGSLFYSIPVSASLTRSLAQQSAGGRTQIASLISCSLMLLFIFWLLQYFEYLPRCVLAAIMIVSLSSIFLQVKKFPKIWRESRAEAFVCVLTCLTVVFINFEIGLLVGGFASQNVPLIKGMKADVCLLGNIPNTDLYLDTSRYEKAKEVPNIKIFHFCGGLHLATRFPFKASLYNLTGLKAVLQSWKKPYYTLNDIDQNENEIKCVIIDFSALTFIDPLGVEMLKQIIKDFKRKWIYLFLAGCSCSVYDMMHRCDLKETADKRFKFFPTVHDAVQAAKDICTTPDFTITIT